MPYVNIRPVPGWEGLYSVTDDGRVWSHPRQIKHSRGGKSTIKGRWLKPSTHRKGYLKLALKRGNTQTTYTMHRLVALAFVPNPLALSQINHIDGNKTNNCAANLEWCTPKQNVHHYMTQNPTKYLESQRAKITKAIDARMQARKQRGGCTPAQKAQLLKARRRTTLKCAADRMQRRADELAQT